MASLFAQRSSRTELMDDLDLANDALRKNLDELEVINYWLGGNTVVINALNRLYPLKNYNGQSIRIADMGSGGGDGLRAMALWARKKNFSATLVGVDANAFMIEYAKEKATNFPEIVFLQKDIFDEAFLGESFDVVVASLFCHHFTDEALIHLFSRWYRQSREAFIINDLERNPLAYYSIYALTRLLGGSYLVKHDAPLSVLRAFKRKELISLLEKAHIKRYVIRWKWAFRYQILVFSEK
ncbi:MAG: methyltransferase domain-containing protein [Cytophagales bacterium]|nr:MAG: methyltransferase domain-containing protein [Cytophagales bacterium]